MRDHPTAAMIFAAGFGTRMMPLTKDRPKPMVMVNERPLIDYALDHVRGANVQNIVVNLHYKGEVLRKHLNGTEVLCIDEQPDILDTGGGLRNAAPFLGSETVFTLNPDVIWKGPNPLRALREAWKPDEMDALLLCVAPENSHGTNHVGDFNISPKGQISRGSGVIFGGCQIIKLPLLETYSDAAFSLNVVWNDLIGKGRCCAAVYDGEWCDVGSPFGVKAAEELLG